jgi:hypothetical protein
VYKLNIENPKQQNKNTELPTNTSINEVQEEFFGDVNIEDVIVKADEIRVHKFDKRVFEAKNLMITIRLTNSSSFASY